MSKEKVKLFYEKVEHDVELQVKLKDIIAEEHTIFIENIVKLGKESGFEFSKEDLQQLENEAITSIEEDGELDDFQLEAVSGGAISFIVIGTGVLAYGGFMATVAGGTIAFAAINKHLNG